LKSKGKSQGNLYIFLIGKTFCSKTKEKDFPMDAQPPRSRKIVNVDEIVKIPSKPLSRRAFPLLELT